MQLLEDNPTFLHKGSRLKTAVLTLLILLMAGSFIIRMHMSYMYEHGDLSSFLRYIGLMQTFGFAEWMSKYFTKLSTGFLYLWIPLTYLDDHYAFWLRTYNGLFDYVAAFWCYRIIRLRYTDSIILPLLCATLVIWTPATSTISIMWGQVDGVYTSFLMGSIYFLMRMQSPQSKPYDSRWAILLFSIAICFKLQAIFFAPALVFLVGHRTLPIWYGLVPLGVYLLMMLPRVLYGFPIDYVFQGYISQIQAYPTISMGAPNPYLVIKRLYADIPMLDMIGKFMGLVFCAGALIAGHKLRKVRLDPPFILWTCSLALFMTPYILPRMHDRYFYPALLISLTLPFFSKKLWPLAFILNFLLGKSYINHVGLSHYNRYIYDHILRLHVPTVVALVSISVFGLAYFWWRQYRLRLTLNT